FGTTVTGLVMTGYYVGFLAGSTLTPRIVLNVGHVRVFSALASLASVAILVHAAAVEPLTWAAMRFVTGFAYAGLYVVAESWLNDRATNESRGQLLSVYMVVLFSGLALGQLLLNVADPAGVFLFLLASVMISLAIVPISLTAGPTPAFETITKISIRQLYRLSPLGVLGASATGMAHGTLFALGAVYGERIGLSVAEISLLMGVAVTGGIVAQWPIGRLSDRFDRRRVITAVALLAAIFALLAAIFGGTSFALLLGLTFLLGCMTLPMYSLCIAHTNDYLKPTQMVRAGATLVLAGGIGACLGPPLAATLMGAVGPVAFFAFLAGVHAAIGLFAVYRMTRRASKPVDEQVPTVPVGSGAAAGTSRLSAETLRNLRDQDLARMSRSGLRRG
ncbi:MAG TPA: MFS transporter, partial [Acidobacteriota bacterium]